MPKAEKPFPTEAALCAAFIDSLDPRYWTPYPETQGWDILLVRKPDGFQIGIEAKLRMNTEVINQALDEYGSWSAAAPGPDCRAVLVPSSAGFDRICKYLALEIIEPLGRVEWGPKKGKWRFNPTLPDTLAAHGGTNWQEWAPASRCPLPAYVPDVVAGSPSPIQLTDWKIKAIKLAVMIEKNGAVARADFRHLNLDHRRWLDGKWLRLDGKVFVPGPGFPDFRKLHPRVYGEIAADYPRWKPKEAERLL